MWDFSQGNLTKALEEPPHQPAKEVFMKKPESTKNVLSRRAFMKSMAAGGGALVLLGTMVNSLRASDLEVFTEPKPKSAKGNEPIGECKCGNAYNCSGSGG